MKVVCTDFRTNTLKSFTGASSLILTKVHYRRQVVNSASKDDKYLNLEKKNAAQGSRVIYGRSHTKLMPEPIRHFSPADFCQL